MTTHFLFPQNKIFDHKMKFNKGEGVEGKLYSLYGSLGKYTVCVLIYTYILSLRGYLGLKSIKLFNFSPFLNIIMNVTVIFLKERKKTVLGCTLMTL